MIPDYGPLAAIAGASDHICPQCRTEAYLAGKRGGCPRCRGAHEMTAQARRLPKKSCKTCGEEFTPNNNSQIYCSEGCRPRKKALHVHASRTCVQCGSEFTPGSNSQKLCSPECVTARKQAYQAARPTTRQGRAQRRLAIANARREAR